jgi:hypothetical protein
MEAGGASVTARRVAAHRLGFERAAAAYGDPAADVAWALGVLVRAGMAAEEAAGPDPGARRGKVALVVKLP